MREIKFRAMSHDNIFYYGFFVNSFPNTPRIVSEHRSTPIKEETLGQFTGLKDRNGKEIYYGDIVELPGWGRKQISDGYASIVYDEDMLGINFSRSFYAEDRYDLRKAISNCVVVGNIHEHGHLLK